MKRIEVQSISDFEKSIREKRIVLFGAGRAMQSFFLNFAGAEFLDRIECVIDNNPAIQNTIIQAGKRTLDVKTPTFLSQNISANAVIIVTNKLNPEIFSQLESMRELSETPVYSGAEISELFYDEQTRSVNLPKSFRVYAEQKIPKVIHYCWFGGKPIPEQYKKWMASWKKFCPDYDIIEWNERNYDYKKHPYMEQAYKAGKWAFVTDYARLDIVHEHGGLYFDTDVELLKNMDDFLYQDGFGGFQPDRRFATGLGIGARKGLPIMKKFMDLYDSKDFVDFATKSERWTKNIEVTPDILTNYTNARGGGGIHQRHS